jgi:hypothetical protein
MFSIVGVCAVEYIEVSRVEEVRFPSNDVGERQRRGVRCRMLRQSFVLSVLEAKYVLRETDSSNVPASAAFEDESKTA